MTPAVIHVAARSITKHALSIFNDHGDVMAVRQTGFAILSSASVQEAHDMAIVAHISTIKSRIPFLHFMDGYRTSHEIQKVHLCSYNDIAKIFPYKEFNENLRGWNYDPNNPLLKGGCQNPDIYFQNNVANLQ